MLSFFNIVIVLQTEPEFGRGAEIFTETQCGVGSDPSPPFDYFTDAGLGNAGFFGQSVSRNTHWSKELLHEHFTGMDVI